MKTNLLSALALLLGIGFIYTPCIPGILFPDKSELENVGTPYIASDDYIFEESEALSVSTIINSRDIEEIPIDSLVEALAADDNTLLQENVNVNYIQFQTENTDPVGYDVTAAVWISKSGKKYHSKPDCSSMKSPSEISLDAAIEKGYAPCKKCFQSS